MQRLFLLISIVCLVFFVGCAAFQTQPALKNFNGLDLYQFIDTKADSAQARFTRLGSAYGVLFNEYNKNLDVIKQINVFLNKEAADGKLDVSTIKELNRRGFTITMPQPDLPSALPDSVSTPDSNTKRKK